MMWVKNTGGKKDAMLTFALIAFGVVTLNVLLATFGRIAYSDFDISFQPMEAATMTAYLAATFSAYVTRRWTDKKYKEDSPVTVVEAKESKEAKDE
jgi:membrane protein implicated in regulation of membrane protease activity